MATRGRPDVDKAKWRWKLTNPFTSHPQARLAKWGRRFPGFLAGSFDKTYSIEGVQL